MRAAGRRATTSTRAFGGSCYLNNAAVGGRPAARSDWTAGSRSSTSTPTTATATQAIFYEDPEVLTGSVHVDPGAGWFPHYLGFAAESRDAGAGDGREPQRAAAARVRRRALARGGRRARRLGAPERRPGARRRRWASTPPPATRRAHCGSPPRAIGAAGRVLGALGLPTVVVQEGGYDLASIGALVEEFLIGIEEGLSG